MPVTGKLELTIKISEFPSDVKTVENGWKEFAIATDGGNVVVKVKPKLFKKLEDAQANYPLFVAAVTGKMGDRTADGFSLLEPAIQVFEKKPKEPKPETATV